LNQTDGVFEDQIIYLKETSYSFKSTAGINNNRLKIMYRYKATLNANSFNREEVQIIKNNYKVAINSPNQTIEGIQI
jgi:hypothetical protein